METDALKKVDTLTLMILGENNTPGVSDLNLVNPSIPKMEVLDACLLNSVKENVFQQYIFKRLKIYSATHKRVTQRGAEHKGPGPRWGTGEHRGGRRLVVDEHLLTTNVRRRRRLVVGV